MEAHEKLLDKWSMESRHAGECFIRDGFIDHSKWIASPRKVLLLLKEAYESGEEKKGYDLCKLIREEWQGPKHNVWQNASYWCLAAQHIESPPSLAYDNKDELDKFKANAKAALFSSAVVNIKKSNGRPSSDEEDLKNFSVNDREYIKKQIEIINPQIVICGYTWSFVRDFWPIKPIPLSDLVYFADGRIFIDYWHPANRYPTKLNYYALAFLLQQAQRTKPELFNIAKT